MAEKNGELKVKYMRKILCYIYENMADFEIVLTLHCLRDIGKLFCTSILGRAGVLKTHHFTTSCSRQHIEKMGCDDPFYWDNYEEKRIVMDKNILTAKGFAFADMPEKISEIFNVFENDDARKFYFDKIRKGCQ